MLETIPLRVVVSYAYLVFSQPPACFFIRLCKHGNHFTFLHYYIKQVDSKLPCGCASCATFLFLPHFDVICDLLLNRLTATRNLFVKYISGVKKLYGFHSIPLF